MGGAGGAGLGSGGASSTPDAAAGGVGDAGRTSDASGTTDGEQPDGGADGGEQLIEFSTCAASASPPTSSSIKLAAGAPVDLGLSTSAVLETLVVADLNHDGTPDLVGSTIPSGSPPWTGAIHAALGNRDGTFAAPITPWAGDRIGTLVAADVTGVDSQDLIVAEDDRHISAHSWYALVLQNDGNNSYQTGTAYAEQTSVLANLGTGDFNNDGLVDLWLVGDGVRVRLNSTAGFGADQIARATVPAAVAVGHFDNDTNLDIAYVDLGDPMVGTRGAVGVLYGRGDGTMRAGASGPLNNYGNYALVVGDFDGDGIDDIATLVGDANAVQRLEIFSFYRRCSGAQPPEIVQETVLGTVRPMQLAAGDVDGDGILDVVVAVDATVMIFRGRGDATFFDPVVVTYGGGAIYGPQNLILTDINNDGRPDLVVDSMPNQSGASNVITVLLNMSTP